MPLRRHPPTCHQAPAGAGVGLRFPERVAQPDWPVDWWQRDLDNPLEFEDVTEGLTLTDRMMRVPNMPEEVVE